MSRRRRAARSCISPSPPSSPLRSSPRPPPRRPRRRPLSVKPTPPATSTPSKRSPLPTWKAAAHGTKGIERAAHLLEQRYQSLGLDPAGTQGFFQPFTVTTGAKLVSGNDLQEDVAGKKKILKLNEDFVPFSFSSSGQAAAPVVFAGYGASAAEFGYDDYAGLDVQGKIVVLLRYEPTGFAAKGGHQGLTQHASLDHQSDQRAQSRRESRRRDQRQARQR